MSFVSSRLNSVLAALEDSIAVGLSRVMGPASPGRAAVPPDAGSPLVPAAPTVAAVPAAVPSPSHEVAASLLRSASLRATSPRARTRSRSPAPLPKRAPRAPCRSSSVASGLRGSVALAESGLVTGLATKSCPPVPPPQLRLSRVAHALRAVSLPPTLLDPLHPPLRPPRPLAPRSLRPTPMMNGTHSSTHTASPHLLVAPRTVLATSVAVVSAKPPSAPCGGTFELLPLPFRVFLPGVASLVGSFWVRVCFRGSCRFVGPCGLLLRLLGSTRALSSVVSAGSGVANSSASLKIWRSPTSATLLPENVCARQSSSSSSLAKRLYRCRICCSWTSLPCSRVWRLQVVS